MRNIDLLILLKLVVWPSTKWSYQQLGESVYMVASQAHKAISNSGVAGLYDNNRNRINFSALEEFLIHGVKYVFPAEIGGNVQGIATAYDALPLKGQLMQSSEPYLWEYAGGKLSGISLKPIHPLVPKCSLDDIKFYEIFSLLDVLRLGESVRAVNIAKKELLKRLK